MDTIYDSSGPLRDLTNTELGSSDLSNYQLLSDSGHNLVYRALLRGKWIVLKAAKPTEGELARNVRLLEREYDIMRSIDSIYVVQTWIMIRDAQLGPCILMEYVQGRTLFDFLKEHPSSHIRQQVFAELLEALDSLHCQQVVHGDLKPSNIMITAQGNHVRLIDFGFSDNDAYIAKQIGSTPAYADQGSPNRDIYALGKILSLLMPHRYGIIQRRCMHSNPRRRYTSVKAIRKAKERTDRGRMGLFLLLICLLLAGLIYTFGSIPTEETNQNHPMVTRVDTVDCLDTIAYLDTIVRVDTQLVMVPESLSSDNLRKDSVLKQMRKEYEQLYLLYRDSLLAFPDTTNGFVLLETIERFVDDFNVVQAKWLDKNEEYSVDITKEHLTLYALYYGKIGRLRKLDFRE